MASAAGAHGPPPTLQRRPQGSGASCASQQPRPQCHGRPASGWVRRGNGNGLLPGLLLLHALAVLWVLPGGCHSLMDVELETVGGKQRYNPSLVEHNGKYISALKTTSFKRINGKTYWVNKLFMCTAQLEDIKALRCTNFEPWQEAYHECELDKRVRNGKLDTTGLGDVKVFKWPGRGVYAIFGRKPERVVDGPFCSDKVVYYQFLAQIRTDSSSNAEWRLNAPLRLTVSNYTYPEAEPYIMEKNWMPFVYRDPSAAGTEQLMAVYTVSPHRIVHLHPTGEAAMRYETFDEALFAKFKGFDIHGGPPVVHVPKALSGAGAGGPYYLGIMHHIERFDGGRVRLYRHFAYRFEPQPPFRVTAISDELDLTFFADPDRTRTAFVTYVAGLYLSRNGTLIISYGAGDLRARALIMSIAELEATFTGKVAFKARDVPYEPVVPGEPGSAKKKGKWKGKVKPINGPLGDKLG